MSAQVIVIHGVTADGRTFRPSDWTERLYYAVASYGPHGQVTFNPFVTIRMTDESRCVVVDTRLRDKDPIVFSFVTGFARDNQLQMFDQDNRPIARAA
jgi:predicted esterase